MKLLLFALIAISAISTFAINAALDNIANSETISDIGMHETVNDGAKADWWDYNWQYRRPITIDNTGNLNALIDYQVYLELTYYPDMNANFADIRFTSEDSETEYDYWIETYTASTSAEVWIEVPNVPASAISTMYIYYGNSSAGDASDFNVTMQKLQWNETPGTLGGIWHFDEGNGTAANDSSPNNNDGVLLGAGYTWTADDGGNWAGTGQTFSSGSALDFAANTGRVSLNYAAVNGADAITTEFWVNSIGTGDGIISGAYGSGGQANEYLITEQEDFDAYINGLHTSANTGFNDGGWHHIAIVRHPNGYLDYFIDAVNIDTDSGNAGPLTIANGGLIIAQEQDSVGGGFNLDQAYDGILDEFGIFGRALSADEITCHYERRKYTDPEPTTSVGDEEGQPVNIKSSSLGEIKAIYK